MLAGKKRTPSPQKSPTKPPRASPSKMEKQQRSPPSASPAEDFRTMHLMPVVDDLLSNVSAVDSHLLRPNSTNKPYPDVDTYLETHIRLLWADFIEPLRTTIGTFCKGTAQVPSTDKANHQIHFYRNVTICDDSFLRNKTVPERPDSWRRYHIEFDSLPGFDWEKSKRLIHGSLVCLWNAASRLIILATVAQSDPEELEQGWLTLSIENPPANVQDFTDKSYTMMECEVFYEPYRVVMEAYQQLEESSFPFKEYLLGWRRDPGIPTYLTTNSKSFRHNYRIQTATGSVVTIKDALNLSTWPTALELGVNPIQRVALHAAMTRRLALIQGPPGTGKTFIGRKIISTLLENKHLWHDDGHYLQDNARLMGQFTPGRMHRFWEKHGEMWRDRRCPIVVICLTNQALDQFMEGVLKSTTKLIRIGSQSQSTLLEAYTMTITKENIFQERKKYNESTFLYHKYRMNGLKKFIDDTVDDIQCLSRKLAKLRRAKPRDLVAESLVQLKIGSLEQIYRAQIIKFNQIKAQSEEALCRSVDVIGLTTTGAARRRDVLALLKPKIVLVEEAAQVLEPHIVASLTVDCQHLIMIGDHLQLRPACNVHKMAVRYQMDVSLFERLIKNGVPSVMLAVQHRMRPEVARLIVPSVYRHLENHQSVLLHPAVPSVQRSVFFLDHDQPEAKEEGGTSFYNDHEAAMTLRLAQFLCQQGIQQEKITVLVTYAAQMRIMLAHRRNHYSLRSVDNVHITTVDNYQGEENDIIILSLVRNNQKKQAGFLRIPNRVCVALSRARHGLFILGNIRLLAGSGSKLWAHVQKILSRNGELGTELSLRCDRHHKDVVKVKKPEDFPMCGIVCSRQCGSLLDCGHPCQMPCRNQCNHAALLCQHPVSVRLPCGHPIQVACSSSKTEDVLLSECQSSTCSRQLECGHPCPLKCAQPCSQAQCQVEVDLDSSRCGHLVKGPCHLGRQADKPEMECQQRCMSVLRCGHVCAGLCQKCGSTGVHSPCQEPCQRTLLCGHPCPVKCAQICPPCQKPCQRRCPHQTCIRPCSQECSPCPESCLWGCAHDECQHPCDRLCRRNPCGRPNLDPFPCGHLYPGYCGEIRPPGSSCPLCLHPEAIVPQTKYVYLVGCGHQIPASQLDNHLEKERIPSCPRCREPIRLVHGRYADRIQKFYEDLKTARMIYDQDGIGLQKAITQLLELDCSQENLSAVVESLVKDKYIEEQWRIYQRMYYLCLSAVYKSRLDETYSFTSVQHQTGQLKLKKTVADQLMARHKAVQNTLLESSTGFLSAQCLADALIQWRRLELLRQCRTMESLQPPLTSKTGQMLKKAGLLLESNLKVWTIRQEDQVFAILKSVASAMDFQLIHPDNQIKTAFFQRVGMSSQDWATCPDCKSIYPSVRSGSCPSADCTLSLKNLSLR